MCVVHIRESRTPPIMLDFFSNRGKKKKEKNTQNSNNPSTETPRHNRAIDRETEIEKDKDAKWLLWIIRVREPSGGKMNQRHTENRWHFYAVQLDRFCAHRSASKYTTRVQLRYLLLLLLSVYYVRKTFIMSYAFCDSTLLHRSLSISPCMCMFVCRQATDFTRVCRFSKITSTEAFFRYFSCALCVYQNLRGTRWNFSKPISSSFGLPMLATI